MLTKRMINRVLNELANAGECLLNDSAFKKMFVIISSGLGGYRIGEYLEGLDTILGILLQVASLFALISGGIYSALKVKHKLREQKKERDDE